MRLIGVSGMVVPQARVPFTCRVSDDYGLTAAAVAYRLAVSVSQASRMILFK